MVDRRVGVGLVAALLAAAVVAAALVWRDPGGVPAPPPGSQAAPLPAPRSSGSGRLPRIVVLAHNANTELTDFVVPYAVLKRSGVAEVWALGLDPGPVRLFPALRAQPDADVATFDARHPDGADYVIVPAVHEDADPRLLAWVRAQAAKGAVVIGICDGVWVLARAGLLDGREAVSHWYSREALARDFASVRWRQDRRYVADRNVVTTTGVSASIPLSLALVETLGGRPRAQVLARQLGLADWGDAHPGKDFHLGPRHLYTAASNTAAFWRHDSLRVELKPGMDDLRLALLADAYARSYRASVVAVAPKPEPVRLASGLAYLPEPIPPAGLSLPLPLGALTARGDTPVLDAILHEMAVRYGPATARFVALQLEYPMDPP